MPPWASRSSSPISPSTSAGRGSTTSRERWVYDGLELIAAAGCLMRAATNRNERSIWAILGLGILSFSLGDICFDFVYGGNPPSPSICDVFYLAFYPACYAALALLVRSRISRFDRSVWLDGAIAALRRDGGERIDRAPGRPEQHAPEAPRR